MRIKTAALADYFDAVQQGASFPIHFPGHGTANFSITSRSDRNSSYRLECNGTAEPLLVKSNMGSYNGVYNGNGQAFFTISPSVLIANFGDYNTNYEILPCKTFPAYDNLYVLYISYQAATNSINSVTCPGIADCLREPQTAILNNTPDRTLELAAECDFEFFQVFNSDSEFAEASIRTRIQSASQTYQTYFKLSIIPAEPILIQTNINDPFSYPNDGRISVALDEFKGFWNGDEYRRCISRDLAHFFTGKPNFVQGAIGNTYAGYPICEEGPFLGTGTDARWGYSIHQHNSQSQINSQVKTIMHELGHSFAGGNEANTPGQPCAECCDTENSSAIMCQGTSSLANFKFYQYQKRH